MLNICALLYDGKRDERAMNVSRVSYECEKN